MHSSFKPVPQPDYIIPVEIEGRIVDVYVLKRPFVDHFLRAVGSRFEVLQPACCQAVLWRALFGCSKQLEQLQWGSLTERHQRGSKGGSSRAGLACALI